MKKVPYILKDLSIRKMPGFPRGLESLNDLAANVNIIAGANASGKSSTARMIQQLIWHDNTRGLEMEGSVVLDTESWEIKIDSERTLVQRNGNTDQMSGLPTAEGQHRYLLALHNLVGGKEEVLAKEIARQSIGGYDLEAAQENLEYSARIYNRGISEYKDFKEAENKYREVRDEQKELKREESGLTNLKSEKEKAQLAARLNGFYVKVADYLDAKLENTQLSEQIDGFPKSMEKLTGEEYENIEECESQIEVCKSTIAKAENDIDKSQNELAALTIPKEGISERTLTEIEERLEVLANLEREIRDSDKQIAGLKSKELTALKGFDDSVDPTKWKELSIPDVGGLDKLLQDAQQVLGEKEYLLSEIKLLEEAKSYENKDLRSETFIQGIKTLSEWLKEPTGASGMPLWVVIAISLLGIASAIATYFVGWPGLLVLVLIVVLFLYAFFTKGKNSSALGVRENDFTKSGLPAITHWDTENVADRLDKLIEDLGDIKEADRISHRLTNGKNSLKELQERIDNLDEKRGKWVVNLQAAPGFPEIGSKNFSSLYWFLQQVKIWQDAHVQRVLWQAQKDKSEEEYGREIKKVNALFDQSNFDEVKDVIEAKATFSELKKQESTRIDQTRIIDQKEEQIQELEDREQSSEQKLSKIYKSVDIVGKNKESVRTLVNQLEAYKQIAKDNYASEQTFSKKKKVLEEHSLYTDYKGEIETLSIDQVKEKATENKDIADGLEKIQQKITSIETLIQSKKKGHELEDVLTAKEEALVDLRQLYENNLSSITGDLIINQLKKETQNKNQPIVFKRANKILNKITNGRYELVLNNKGEPNFRAYDTVLKLGQSLSELSTGTRIQLLLSVRLAYVETVESYIKLPLLADELLANSDDNRAKAIIESLIEISREGRQVFYFTAQADEVGKWLTHLKEQPDINYKIFQLDGGANEAYDFSEHSSIAFNQATPQPNGQNHEEYGATIQKLPFNVLMQNASELPLWYLIEDVDLVYACLNKGIKSWGQLESYFRYDGQIQDFDKEIYNQIIYRVELLKRYRELYRKGRSLPINRAILESSGAVTSAFIDRVAEKSNELNGDPKKLLQALRDGEVSRFRTDSADELEDYLLTEGYIDDREALKPADILINLQAFLSNSDLKIDEAEKFMNRILNSGGTVESDMS